MNEEFCIVIIFKIVCWVLWLLLVIFVGFVVFVMVGLLCLVDCEVVSVMIGKLLL